MCFFSVYSNGVIVVLSFIYLTMLYKIDTRSGRNMGISEICTATAALTHKAAQAVIVLAARLAARSTGQNQYR